MGIWSWQQDAITTASARTELLSFCRKEGITHIDQHVSLQQTDGAFQLRNAGKLKRLVKEANDMGVSVSVLLGNKTMFFAKFHQDNLSKLAALAEFNAGLPEELSLRGIKYDVEPYLTDEWKAGGDQRLRVMQYYLIGLTQIRDWLVDHDSRLELSVDIPFWWDKSELELEYENTSQAFTHHIQDRVDSISIMSYRRAAADVLRLSAQELDYARGKQQERSVAVGLNFNSVAGEEAVTTFAGHPQLVYRKTLSKLRTQLAGNKTLRCIMLHDYKHLKRYLEEAEASEH